MNQRYKTVARDTTVKLWEYLYRVRIPYIHARSIEDIKMYGTNITGVPEIDKDYASEIITCMITVNQMVEYYKEGVPIRIPSQSDIKEIYDSISDHLYAWKDRLYAGINIFNAPIEDLILMDKFANAIYDHAKYHFTDDVLNSLTASHLVNLSPINTMNMFKPSVKEYIKGTSGVTIINKETEEEKLPERESLGEYFGKRMPGIRRF